MLQMQETSRHFLKDNLPNALAVQTKRAALQLLFDLIEEKGFAPPTYEWYNEFGHEAQRVYDDIYLSNT